MSREESMLVIVYLCEFIHLFILTGQGLLACASSAFTEGLVHVQTLGLAELSDHL